MNEWETVEIPRVQRKAVDERDKGFCRMCGRFLGQRRAIHHIDFGGDRQGMGGRRDHALDNLVSLCWLPGDSNCHQRAHSEKSKWLPILQAVVNTPANTTALQLERWSRRKRR